MLFDVMYVHSTDLPRGIILGENVCGCGFDNSYVFHIRNHSCNQIALAHVWLTLYQLDIWVCYTFMVVCLWSLNVTHISVESDTFIVQYPIWS